jgi:hypothetical protein
MTPKSFFIILVKLFGIILVFQLLAVIPTYIVIFTTFFNESYHGKGWDNFFLILLLLTPIFLFLLCKFIITKSEVIVNKIGLVEDFEEEKFEFNMNPTIILKLTFTIVGFYLLLTNVLPLFLNIYQYFKTNNLPSDFIQKDSTEGMKIDILFSFIYAILGYFLLTNSALIAKWVVNKNLLVNEDCDDK